MENMNVFANEDNQVNGERPPPRVCPRCNSDNTKFCYYNNYSVSQPRYSCKNCRRFWTHGGALRNVPVGGSCRKAKRVRVDQSPVSRMVSAEIQQVNHQPFSYVQENNEFIGSFGASSAAAVGNRFVSLSDIHGGMVTNVPPSRSFRPNHRLEYHDGSFEQDYYDLGPNDLIGNPMMNQSFGGDVDNHNEYRMNQVDQHKWNHQSFNNAMKMNHNASTSGNRGSDMNMNMNSGNNKFRYTSLIKHPRHLEKHGP